MSEREYELRDGKLIPTDTKTMRDAILNGTVIYVDKWISQYRRWDGRDFFLVTHPELIGFK